MEWRDLVVINGWRHQWKSLRTVAQTACKTCGISCRGDHHQCNQCGKALGWTRISLDGTGGDGTADSLLLWKGIPIGNGDKGLTDSHGFKGYLQCDGFSGLPLPTSRAPVSPRELPCSYPPSLRTGSRREPQIGIMVPSEDTGTLSHRTWIDRTSMPTEQRKAERELQS